MLGGILLGLIETFSKAYLSHQFSDAIVFSVLMIFGIALLAVAYATGGSFERLIRTTDIADMTKFISREQLLVYVTAVFRFFGAA